MSTLSKACVCVLGLAALVAFGATAPAAIDGPIGFWVGNDHQFTISNADLATMRALGSPKDPHPDGSLTEDPYDRPGENNTQFKFELTDKSGYRDFQVGWEMASGPGTLPSEYWDLRDYDSMMLSFHNETQVPDGGAPEKYAIMVNLFMNTGWTDLGETDLYAQNTWTWILPGESAVLDLDFSNAERWQGGEYLGWGDITTNLQHVSALGFNIGSNAPGSGDYSFRADYEGKICVDTIPEPASMIVWGLLGVLGFGLAWWRARR